ncbi:hypothetical protein K7X08_001442 [Anisodus acutangulus]|uniref:Uncharacterized protein n=1 Tax=Anisodus acutangulus TaxID=402998 RepID=A0A9Q1RNC8_9SOLA|nr:hypothetical protein K7X08_001442 [Anisodus acutangulus]
MAEDMNNKIQDLSKPLTPSKEHAKESKNAQGCGDVKGQGAVVEKDEAGKAEDEGLVHVVVRAKLPTPPGKRPGPTTG